jgi:hypothetical protein
VASRGNASAKASASVATNVTYRTRESGCDDEKEGGPITDLEIVERIAEEIDRVIDASIPIPPNVALAYLFRAVGFQGPLEEMSAKQFASCIDDVEKLLKHAVEEFLDDKLQEPARIFLGLTPGMKGAKITHRKNAVAELIERTPRTAHTRRREICRKLAWQIYRYANARGAF